MLLQELHGGHTKKKKNKCKAWKYWELNQYISGNVGIGWWLSVPSFRLHPLLCIDAVFLNIMFAEISLVLLETTRRGQRKLGSLYIYTGLQAVLVLMIQLHTNQVLSVSWTVLDCLIFQPFANGGSKIKLHARVCACKIIYLTQVCSTNRLGGKRLECHANRVNC